MASGDPGAVQSLTTGRLLATLMPGNFSAGVIGGKELNGTPNYDSFDLSGCADVLCSVEPILAYGNRIACADRCIFGCLLFALNGW
jgi:hypothetical protein